MKGQSNFLSFRVEKNVEKFILLRDNLLYGESNWRIGVVGELGSRLHISQSNLLPYVTLDPFLSASLSVTGVLGYSRIGTLN